jgi:hypothetical protein
MGLAVCRATGHDNELPISRTFKSIASPTETSMPSSDLDHTLAYQHAIEFDWSFC